MTEIMIEIPDELISQLQEQNYSVQEIIIKALKDYIQSQGSDLSRKSRTRELCGSFEIAEPESKYIIGQNQEGKLITNYAQNVDETIY